MIDRCTRRRYLGAVGATAVGVAVAGCSGRGGGTGERGPTTVDMTDDLTFEPETLAVEVGATVTWRTIGTVGHTATAYGDEIPSEATYFASGGFDSEDAARDAYPDGNVPAGDAYEHTFEVAGTYPYFCVPHERTGMRGTIEVTER